MGACPLKDLEVPVYGSKRVSSCKGHPCACFYWRSSRCPFLEANAHVSSSQGNPLARAHFRILGVLQPAEKAQRHPMNPMSGPSLLSKILSDDSQSLNLSNFSISIGEP